MPEVPGAFRIISRTEDNEEPEIETFESRINEMNDKM